MPCSAHCMQPRIGRIVSGTFLRLWDLATGETLRTLEGHTGSVNAIALLGDGRRTIGTPQIFWLPRRSREFTFRNINRNDRTVCAADHPRPQLDAWHIWGCGRRHADQFSWKRIRAAYALRWCRGDVAANLAAGFFQDFPNQQQFVSNAGRGGRRISYLADRRRWRAHGRSAAVSRAELAAEFTDHGVSCCPVPARSISRRVPKSRNEISMRTSAASMRFSSPAS
jgi:hypothetical protein